MSGQGPSSRKCAVIWSYVAATIVMPQDRYFSVDCPPIGMAPRLTYIGPSNPKRVIRRISNEPGF